jgi:hypothetical protein
MNSIKKNNDNLLFTTIHPKSLKYFYELKENIAHFCSYFDLFICINNVENYRKYIVQINKLKFNKIYVYNLNVSPGLARIKSFKRIIKLKYEKIMLLDSDDLLEKKRVEIFKYKNANNYDFFVNNLKSFCNKERKKKILIKKNIKKITLNRIINSNFVGLSNLTIKKEALKKIINKLNCKLISFDWCIITELLLNNCKGKYFHKYFTLYRQHSQNINNGFKKNKMIFNLNIKIAHYKHFELRNKIFKSKLKFVNKLKELYLSEKKFSEKKYYNLLKWWF